MSAQFLRVLDVSESSGASADLDGGIELLRAAQRGQIPETLRVYTPQPTLAFGQRDTRLPGFEAAHQASLRHGFEPLVRKAGGRAAAYHEGTLIVDHIARSADAMMEHRSRFIRFAELFTEVFHSLGISSGIGEIPGEYCPGEYTVHGWGPENQPIKLVGTAQRVVQGAWFFSSVIVVREAEPLARVLDEVYKALEIPMNPSTVGSLDDAASASKISSLPLTVESVKEALMQRYAAEYRLEEATSH